MKYMYIILLSCLLQACEGVTAFNIPGIGNFDLDPMPLTDEDKHLQYVALKAFFDNGTVGESTSWSNPDSRASGTLTITRGFERVDSPSLGEMQSAPCWEYTEKVITTTETRTTSGKAACKVTSGEWKRIK